MNLPLHNTLIAQEGFSFFCAPKEAAMPNLRGMDRQLARSEKAEVYKSEIKNLS